MEEFQKKNFWTTFHYHFQASNSKFSPIFHIFEIPPFAHHVIFITEFVLLFKIPPFYEVNSFNRKWLVHGGISKIFFLDYLSPSFFQARNAKISPIFHFDWVNSCRICHILCVKQHLEYQKQTKNPCKLSLINRNINFLPSNHLSLHYHLCL